MDTSFKNEITKNKSKNKSSTKKYIILVIILGFLTILGLTIKKNKDLRSELKELKESPAQLQKEVDEKEYMSVVEKVRTVIDFPADEKPQIATVSDKTKLANNDFYKNAENGDKLILLSTSQKAILYRPSTNKIINVAPLILDTTSGTNNDTTPAQQ
jgi:hypothetical protein